ncbi:hypothetical protein [Pseudohoeflea coraliihabitans]|uniref:Uncharacterized protein n=1 Tax=Pseudohoeflea coraliihabitans TaxID=2860393 RepID=A0ABS6WID9_9HYPH|nr:hypothetical protein [Pseudohoeflea sp. DP4N28-3]MBW3095723.1 hypothetical protein [Pseudohoeflea sp. DP4N28-3]
MAIITRRFIIICLAVAIFAMLLTAVVTKPGRQSSISAIHVCQAQDDPACVLDWN